MNQKPYTILFVHAMCPNNGNLITGEIVYACSAGEAERNVLAKNPGSNIVMISQTENRGACFDKYFALKRRFGNPTAPVYVNPEPSYSFLRIFQNTSR